MQFQVELKHNWGKFTDKDLQQIGGNLERFISKVQERYGDQKGQLMKWAHNWLQQSAPEAEG